MVVLREKKAFAVQFQCHNCGHSWWEEFYKGDVVYSGILNIEAPYVKDHRCTHNRSCPYCRRIQCPICEAEEEVSIKDRKPLNTEEQ